MVAGTIAWITCTPYGTGLLIGHWRPLNRAVARFVIVSALFGWSALLVVVVGVLFKHQDGGVVAALIAAPFVGLAFWIPVHDEGPDDDPPEPPDDPPPSGDTLDWNEFERARHGWEREPELV